MKKILVATEKPFHPNAVEGIKNICSEAGYEFKLLEKYTDKSELLDAVKDANALIIRSDKVTREVIDAGKNLEIIVRGGAGYDNVDLEAATEKNIVVMNTPGQNSNAVAELALGMMVYSARNQFNGKAGTELRDKKLGIHAFGNVGSYVADIARGFGMELYAHDPYVDNQLMQKAGIHPVENVKDLYKNCDYISLHIPANGNTRQSINYDLLSIMPENGTLVNTARKEVINEDDLLKVFEEKPTFKYVTDIAPDCKDTLESKYADRYYATPKKMGAQTAEANINAGLAAAKQIVDYFKNGVDTFKVN